MPDGSLFGKGATNAALEVLASQPDRRFTQFELAESLEHSEASVRRAVDVLEANGLVHCRYVGNRKEIAINRDRLTVPGDPIGRIPQAEFQEPVAAATEAILECLEAVLGIVLFGSVARGEADRLSDIDLWVAVASERPANQRRANDLEGTFRDRRFDGDRYALHIVVESVPGTRTFDEDVRSILETGLVLHETDEFDTVRQRVLRGEWSG